MNATEYCSSTCDDFTSNFASPHMKYFVDDNSVCVHTGDDADDESNKGVAASKNSQNRNASHRQRDVTKSPLHHNENLGKESSWASIDGRQQQRFKSEEGFDDQPTDEDRTRGTSYDDTNTHCDESSRSFANRPDSGEARSDSDPLHTNLILENFRHGLFGLPLNWTHVVKKKSSWSSNSHKTSATSSTTSNSSCSNSSGRAPKSRSDDHNSLGHNIDLMSMHDSLGEHHHVPSFGKSREFRSFGSHRSLEDQASSHFLKPTYMTADESKQLHEESSRYKYILPSPSSDRSSTASQNPQGESSNELTTTIPYSSLSKS